jgi:tRNA (adenine22-N1)-methyltransferase
MVKITERLARVASYVYQGAHVADIGTDHALLPAYLIQTKTCDRVIAVDVNPGPLSAARSTVVTYHLEEQIDIREGDGLKPLLPGEANLLVIAGMGGVKMMEILEASPSVLPPVRRLILQPLGAAVTLRHWLLEHGWQLTAEDLVLEDGRFYLIIVAEPHVASRQQGDHAGQAAVAVQGLSEEQLLEIGPKLLEEKHPLLVPFLEKQLHDLERTAKALERARTPAAKEMQQVCQQKIKFLREMIKCQFVGK